MKTSGAEMIWRSLLQEGVDIVFGYPGGAVLPAYDALLKFPLRHILARHEQGAAHMADGYARASGRTGVVIATSGPGATNLITGLANAMMDSIPLLAITGQVPSPLLGKSAFQEVDIASISMPVTKHNFLVTRAEKIGPVLQEAFAIVRQGRPGPVLVDITRDAQQAQIEMSKSREPRRSEPAFQSSCRPTVEQVNQALNLLQNAKRPLILAGQGIIAGNATPELRTLAERLQIPVATTLMGLGALPAGHPLNLGMMGMHGRERVNRAIQSADLLLALGIRFGDRVTGDVARFAPSAKKIHVDFDGSELGKIIGVDLAICSGLDAFLGALLAGIPPGPSHPLSIPRQYSASSLPEAGPLSTPAVIQEIRRQSEGKALLVTDVGQHQMWAARHYPPDKPRHFITSGGLGTMGFALPAAIGAKLARPEEEVWVIVGDGGFQMTLPELMTLVQEGLKLNIAVINNGYLGMVRQWQAFFFENRYSATPLQSPDFLKLAAAFGIPARRARTGGEATEAIREARQAPGPFLLDLQVDTGEAVLPMVPPGAALDEMILPAANRVLQTPPPGNPGADCEPGAPVFLN